MQPKKFWSPWDVLVGSQDRVDVCQLVLVFFGVMCWWIPTGGHRAAEAWMSCSTSSYPGGVCGLFRQELDRALVATLPQANMEAPPIGLCKWNQVFKKKVLGASMLVWRVALRQRCPEPEESEKWVGSFRACLREPLGAKRLAFRSSLYRISRIPQLWCILLGC